MSNYFPISGLAKGKAFCNRQQEREKLKYNIETSTATLVISPRRYGKTSLVHQVLRDIQIPFAHIDLYKALSEEDIVDFILTGIGQLLGKIEPKPDKLIKVAAEFFSGLQITLSAQGYGLSVKWDRKNKRPVDMVIASLEKLDAYAHRSHRQVVIYLDEFQSIYQVMRNNYSIEAAIREVAQKSLNTIYIFSGSTRHIIDGIFNDKARPFYRLCDTIYLKRIETKYYKPYINKAAKERWRHLLNEKVIDQILALTENYPYYVNKLCHLLWASTAMPTIESAKHAWYEYAYESKMSIDKQIDELSLNQKRIMIRLCQAPTAKPFSNHTAREWDMNPASIHQAIKVLIEKDHIYQREDGYYDIVDPLVKTVLYRY